MDLVARGSPGCVRAPPAPIPPLQRSPGRAYPDSPGITLTWPPARLRSHPFGSFRVPPFQASVSLPVKWNRGRARAATERARAPVKERRSWTRGPDSSLPSSVRLPEAPPLPRPRPRVGRLGLRALHAESRCERAGLGLLTEVAGASGGQASRADFLSRAGHQSLQNEGLLAGAAGCPPGCGASPLPGVLLLQESKEQFQLPGTDHVLQLRQLLRDRVRLSWHWERGGPWPDPEQVLFPNLPRPEHQPRSGVCEHPLLPELPV